MHIYSDEDLGLLKSYRITSRVKSINRRFTHNIISIDILNALKRCGFRCHYCNEPLKKESWQLDHFHSKAMGGLNECSNLAPSCKWCNQMKNALDGNAFLIRVKKILFANLDTEVPHPLIRNTNIAIRDFPINSRYSNGKHNFKNNPNFHIITNRIMENPELLNA